ETGTDVHGIASGRLEDGTPWASPAGPAYCSAGGVPARGALLDPCRLVERQARRAREDRGRVPAAEVDQDVGAHRGALEERLVDLGVVEPGHRAGVQAQGARGQDQVGGL